MVLLVGLAAVPFLGGRGRGRVLPVSGDEPWLARLRGAREREAGAGSSGTITVVIPCFKQGPFIRDTLISVAEQAYPAASIVVVDDASPDGCADIARETLLGELSERRRAQRAALGRWLGLAPDELRALRDEVLTTPAPSRGVAAARNRALGAASTEWVCCLDGDDLLAPEYFAEAMRAVAGAPELNLVYANQQFFGESRWRWDVPEWSPQAAVASGPLPVMTVFRRSLWAATPHGFDEALPKGHEDWSLWLQFARLPVRAHKLGGWLLLYRYRASSKKRTREALHPEVPRLLRCLYPDLYPRRALLDDHAALAAGGLSEGVLDDVRRLRARLPARAVLPLWLGMHAEHEGRLRDAAKEYADADGLREEHDWQPALRLACVGSRLGDHALAQRACAQLLRLWGAQQARWYLQQGEPAERCCALPPSDGGAPGAMAVAATIGMDSDGHSSDGPLATPRR